MKGWLLIESLLVLLVANALAWFVVAFFPCPHSRLRVG
jgi:hypothetical protein